MSTFTLQLLQVISWWNEQTGGRDKFLWLPTYSEPSGLFFFFLSWILSGIFVSYQSGGWRFSVFRCSVIDDVWGYCYWRCSRSLLQMVIFLCYCYSWWLMSLLLLSFFLRLSCYPPILDACLRRFSGDGGGHGDRGVCNVQPWNRCHLHLGRQVFQVRGALREGAAS